MVCFKWAIILPSFSTFTAVTALMRKLTSSEPFIKVSAVHGSHIIAAHVAKVHVSALLVILTWWNLFTFLTQAVPLNRHERLYKENNSCWFWLWSFCAGKKNFNECMLRQKRLHFEQSQSVSVHCLRRKRFFHAFGSGIDPGFGHSVNTMLSNSWKKQVSKAQAMETRQMSGLGNSKAFKVASLDHMSVWLGIALSSGSLGTGY